MANKILIIEDEQILLNILVDKFILEGFEVTSSVNGREGLATAIKNHPDIILLDIIMPVMDGMTMLELLRQDPWGKTAQVILLTNLSDAEKAIKSTSQGVMDYLIKCDLTIDNVVARVKERIKMGEPC